MNPRETLTSKFDYQKRNFQIIDELDKKIERFILKLNKNENIVTSWSCEGMDKNTIKNGSTHSIVPYFSFNVNDKTWDLVWTQVIPELMMKIQIQVSTNCYEESIFIHYPYPGGYHKDKFWKAVFEVFGKYFIEK